MSETLKPCPFCGGEATHDVQDNGERTFWIVCDNVKDGCGCEGPYQHSEEDAIAAWNRRHEPALASATSECEQSRKTIADLREANERMGKVLEKTASDCEAESRDLRRDNDTRRAFIFAAQLIRTVARAAGGNDEAE